MIIMFLMMLGAVILGISIVLLGCYLWLTYDDKEKDYIDIDRDDY